MDRESFEGRRGLVVGGSGGIGRAVAAALAERGAEVTVHGGSSRERLREAVAETGGRGFLCSAGEPGAAERILAAAPDPDILVCAWGPFLRRPLEEMDEADWQRMVQGNLVLPGTLVSRVLGGMKKRRWGRILLLGGTCTDTIRGFTTTTAYGAAKTGLGTLARSAARAGAPWGVTCNVLCPGLTDTEYLGEEARAYNRERSPTGRALEPAAIARVALAILENPGINGAIVPVDQGLVL